MFTRVSYGDFEFPFPTVAWTENPRFDEQGTQTGVVYEIAVSGLLNGTTPTATALALQDAECELNKPRQTLTIETSTDESTWIPVVSITADDDVAFGPLPGQLRVSTFTGGLAATYTWTCTSIVKRCYDGNCDPVNRPSDVLSVVRRWTHSVDALGLTTRTVSGRVLVTSGSALAAKPADVFRLFATPPDVVNFQRVNQEYSQSESGTEITFAVTDQERMWTLPPGIGGGSNASFEIRVPDPLGGDRRFMVQYVLSGSFAAPVTIGKGAIIQQIGALAAAKFGLNAGNSIIPGAWSLTEDVYGNSVAFHITAWQPFGTLPDGNPDFANIPGLGQFGSKPPGSNGTSQKIGAYGSDGTGSSGVLGPGIKLYDACGSTYQSGQSSGRFGSDPGIQSNPPTSSINQPQDGTSSGVSDIQLANPFVMLHEVISCVIDPGIRVLDPAQAGVDPFVQQVKAPAVTFIYAGYRKQLAKSASEVQPVPPPPLVAAGMGVLLAADVGTATPDPAATGAWLCFGTKFRYVVRYTKALKATDLKAAGQGLGIYFPQDPSRPAETDAARTLPGTDLGIPIPS